MVKHLDKRRKSRLKPKHGYNANSERIECWNSSLLSEAVVKQFGLELGREVIRIKLLELSS